MIRYQIKGVITYVDLRMFKDGCVNINTHTDGLVKGGDYNIRIQVQFGTEGFSINDELIAVAMVKDALQKEYPTAKFVLDMPYIPYARQDRACNVGEAFSLKVIGRFINSLEFDVVNVMDPHSSVADACIDRMYASTQFEIFGHVKPTFINTMIVAPDAGASKKCEEFAKLVGAKGVVFCSKKRNPKTMEIEGLEVIGEIPEFTSFLVMDDLCDGGRTFVAVAKAIREKADYHSEIDLAITHGLFTYGVEVVADVFNNVYTTDSFYSNKKANNVKVIKVW